MMSEKEMTNPNEEIENEEVQDAEEAKFEDKRRFDDSGERVDVKVDGKTANEGATETERKAPTLSEVVKLENDLTAITDRCRAAEDKLVEVQKRFESERANLEQETSEMRTRMKKSLEQQANSSRFNFLVSLLPVLDNLNLALQAAEIDTNLDNLIGGVQGTARSFEQSLISVGVQPIEAVGAKFDPMLHEAVDMVETGEENEGLIIKEYARGYTYDEKLLRPSRVQVGTAAKSQAG